MGYDSWENVGYKVIDKINSFDEILSEMREDLAEIKTAQATIQTKVWVITIGSLTVLTLASKLIGL